MERSERLGLSVAVVGHIALFGVLSLGIVAGGYAGNDYFRERVDAGIDELVNYQDRPNTSIGLRIVYASNAWRMFSESPWLGVGIGDYLVEYTKVNAIHTPQWEPMYNPHNQYLYALTNAGIPAGVLVLAVLLFPLVRRGPADGRQRIRKALPVLFIPICLFESYLMRSNLSMMYVLFLAALWCGVKERPACNVCSSCARRRSATWCLRHRWPLRSSAPIPMPSSPGWSSRASMR